MKKSQAEWKTVMYFCVCSSEAVVVLIDGDGAYDVLAYT